MSVFMTAMARGSEPGELVAECCRQLGDSRHCNFGVLYLSDLLATDTEGILESLRLGTGVQCWVGAVAMGVCSNAGEIFGEPALAVMVARMPEDAFRTFVLPEEDPRAAAMHGEWVASHSPHVALVHADPRSAEVVANIQDIGESSFVLGGLLSSRGRYAHVADRVRETGLSGVLFSPDVAISTRLSQGCRPLGPRHTVTRADGQLLYELDHRGAADLLAEELTAEAATPDGGPGVAAGGLHIAIIMPGDDGRDYLVRNLLGMEEEHRALVVGDRMEVGQSVRFCRRDAVSAEADLREMLQNLKRRLPGPPRGAIYVSCLARGPNLFSKPDLEVGLIAEILGDFPMVGFFANGEFARDRIYGYTGVLTVFT